MNAIIEKLIQQEKNRNVATSKKIANDGNYTGIITNIAWKLWKV